VIININNISEGLSVTQTAPTTVRIDDEDSFLGLVKFCKDNGKTANPFMNTSFAENCGVCMSSGKLITGETFSEPTGVVVYKQDKEAAKEAQKKNGYPFAYAIPSLGAATCRGASLTNTAKLVLAIDSNYYGYVNGRNFCENTKTFDNGCGQCIADNSWSYLGSPISDVSTSPITLTVWGSGEAFVTIAGRQIGEKFTLNSSNAVTRDLGSVQEGIQIELDVSGSSSIPPHVYGIIQGNVPNGNNYKVPIETFLEKDSKSGYFTRSALPKLFPSISTSLMKLIPASGQTSMHLTGRMPMTFIQPENYAANDCPTTPYLTAKSSAADILTTDPCLKNIEGQNGVERDQYPGNYTEACLRTKIIGLGCSTSGNWWQDPNKYANPEDDDGVQQRKTLVDFSTWLSDKFQKVTTDSETSFDCYGRDIPTPCDNYMNNPMAVPNQACLSYLYSGESIAAPSLGSGYLNERPRLSNASDTTIGKYQFCSSAGAANPLTNPGKLTDAARSGYDGVYGIDAVKRYLSKTFAWAMDTNKSSNLPDASGGNNTSRHLCFGDPLYTPPRPSAPSVQLQDGGGYPIVTFTAPDSISSYSITVAGSTQQRAAVASGTRVNITFGQVPYGQYRATVVATNVSGSASGQSGNVTIGVYVAPPPDPVDTPPTQPITTNTGCSGVYAYEHCGGGGWSRCLNYGTNTAPNDFPANSVSYIEVPFGRTAVVTYSRGNLAPRTINGGSPGNLCHALTGTDGRHYDQNDNVNTIVIT